jgi:hypothetical protein
MGDYVPADVSAGLVTRPSKMNEFEDFGEGHSGDSSHFEGEPF